MHDYRHDPQTGSVLNHLAAKGNPPQCNVYELRAPFDLHMLTDIDSLCDVVERLAARVARLEADNAALRSAVERHGDALSVLQLRGNTVTAAVKIHRDARGNWSAHPVRLNYSTPQPLAVALCRVRTGRTVFVTEADAAAVLDAAREGVGSGADG